MFLNALNKQYDRVRQIARLKLYGRAMACDTFSDNTFSLVLRIFLDQEIFFGSLLVLFTYSNRRILQLL